MWKLFDFTSQLVAIKSTISAPFFAILAALMIELFLHLLPQAFIQTFVSLSESEISSQVLEGLPHC